MGKIYFLLAIAFFGIFTRAGCGKTDTAAAQNTAKKTNTAATKTDAPATTILKLGDVSPDKAVKVIDLVDSRGS